MPFLASVFTPETASVLRRPKAATVLFFPPSRSSLELPCTTPLPDGAAPWKMPMRSSGPFGISNGDVYAGYLPSHEPTWPPIFPQTVPSPAEHIPDRQSLERRANRAAEPRILPELRATLNLPGQGEATPRYPHTPPGTLVQRSPRLGSRMSGPLAARYSTSLTHQRPV